MKINLEIAKRFIGTPYVWGGDNEVEGGLDCSGYLYNVLKGSGIQVSRDTAQGYYNKFKPFEVKSYIESGDLLFFGKSTSKITHVAIAVDNKHMIESVGKKSNTIKNKGKGVCINLISRRKDLVAICRLEQNVSRETLDIPSAIPNLKVGSRGVQVERLQKCLNVLFNAGLKNDGLFGLNTKKALMKVQASAGLISDGIYGNHTRRVLLNLVR